MSVRLKHLEGVLRALLGFVLDVEKIIDHPPVDLVGALEAASERLHERMPPDPDNDSAIDSLFDRCVREGRSKGWTQS